MRALVQRVSQAAVHVAESEIASIGPGLLVLLGVTHEDDFQLAERLAEKVLALRIFQDEHGRMNEPLAGTQPGGTGREILCVSQFTLYADTARGNRPSFLEASRAEHARPLYEHFCERCKAKRGVFGAHMRVALTNDGPVTLLLEVSGRSSSPSSR